MLKLEAYFTGFSSKSDGSAGLRFATQEIDAETFAELKNELNNFGWLLFKGNEMQEADIPKEEAEEDKMKSPSARLRHTLYRLWEKQGKQGTSDAHYRANMEKFIDHIKSKLD
jgi:hypothetical protein